MKIKLQVSILLCIRKISFRKGKLFFYKTFFDRILD